MDSPFSRQRSKPNLFLHRSPSSFSSSSSAAALLVYSNQKPLRLRHTIAWKHFQEPADSARLEEFNKAIRRDSDHMVSAAVDSGDRKRAAGMSSAVAAVAPEKTGQVVDSEGVSAARSAPDAVDGPKAADSGVDHQRQGHADSARLGESDEAVRSGHVAAMADFDGGGCGREKKAVTGSVPTLVPAAPETREVAFEGVPLSTPSSANVYVKRKRSTTGVHRRAREPERSEVRAGDEAASASARSLNGGIRLSSAPATAPPAGDVSGEDNRIKPAIEAHRPPPAPGSGKACAGDQDPVPSSSAPAIKNPFRVPLAIPSSHSRQTKPAEAVALSYAAADDATGGGLYDLGVAAAAAMDDEAILSEVAKYIGVEPRGEQRSQRQLARKFKAAETPVFSLRLSDEEAMADVAAVSGLLKDVADADAQASVVYGRGKRRRR